MTGTTKSRPSFYCVKCRGAAEEWQNQDTHCSWMTAVPDGLASCGGVFASALGPNDWRLCADCAGAGSVTERDCRACHASGWITTRTVP